MTTQIVRKQLDLDTDGFFNVGSGGFDGFESNSVNKNQGRVIGGHSAALVNHDSISDYIINGNINNLPNETTKSDETIGFLKKVSEKGLFKSMENSDFADIKRTETGGKGLDGVFKKSDNYFNPFMEKMKFELGI